MNAQQLRNSILQEAIEGRLVPQDPNDEPASVLLNRIREEKKRLFKEGKLKKKDLEEKPINDEEKPFEIPESWEWVRLSILCSRFSTGPFGTMVHKEDYVETNGFPLINPTNIVKGVIYRDGIKMVSNSKYCELSSYVLQTNDIVLARRGDLSKIAIVSQKEDGWLAGTGAFFMHIFDGVFLPYFVWLYTSSYCQSYLLSQSVGGTMNNLNQTLLADFLLPLPPLAEQKRIVAKIEELFPKVEEYGKAQDALNKLNEELPDRLKKSILQEAITGRLVPQDPNDEPASVLLDKIRAEKKQLVKEGKLNKKDLIEIPITDDEKPFDIPDSWEWVRVKEVFSINPKVVADDNADAAFIPMEKIEACYGSRFSYEIRKWKTIKSSFTCFADGDVAFAKITPCFQNRKSMILKNLPNGIGAGTTELKVLRQYAETIVRGYLLYFLASSYFIDEATFKGTANQQRIIVGYLENKLFPLPPLAEQKRIVAKIEEVFKEIDKLKK